MINAARVFSLLIPIQRHHVPVKVEHAEPMSIRIMN
jgi:hypothetical protein